MTSLIRAVVLLACLSQSNPSAAATIDLALDARDVAHGIQHAHLKIPVQAGPVVLGYPKWIRGEHAPNGAITQVANLYIRAGGQELEWKRDSKDLFEFHVNVPDHTEYLDVDFDFFSPPEPFGAGFGKAPNGTSNLEVLLFNQFLLYPLGHPLSRINIHTTLELPDGWSYDSSLTGSNSVNGPIQLPLVDIATLVDSPLVSGRFMTTTSITMGRWPTRLTVASDAGSVQPIPGDRLKQLGRLVSEATTVFGDPRYHQYSWQLILSDAMTHDGTEHQSSSDIREANALFIDPDYGIDLVLFSHEFVHTWNGKARRPRGLIGGDFQQPMEDDLLWVYEGLTRYYGDFVLAARSGLLDARQARDYLAFVAAQASVDRPGRAWRPLVDTATSEPLYEEAPQAWTSVRRGHDYYNEMLLVWLEADTLIRARTDGGKSLDDFTRRFFKSRDPGYTKSEVVDKLNETVRLDWTRFFRDRVYRINPLAPLGGIESAGWMLEFDDTPNPFLVSLEKIHGVADFSWSLGIWISTDGTIQDAIPDSVAFRAGATPGMRITAVNGAAYTPDVLREALIRSETNPQYVELAVRRGEDVHSLQILYQGGLRYPHLTRKRGTEDTLSAVLLPRAQSRCTEIVSKRN